MKVLFILAYIVLTAHQYRCDTTQHGYGICGFQFELLLAHLADFESRIAGRYETNLSNITSILERLEANVFQMDERMKQMEAKIAAIESRIEDRLEITLAQINSTIEENGKALQSQMEKQFTQKTNELERNVKEGYEKAALRIVDSGNYHREFLFNQPALAREEGWITIQRRFDGSVNFHRTWNEYKYGFGDHQEFWVGLEKIYQRTSYDSYELLLVLEDFDGEIVYAHYDEIRIGSENENYELKVLGNFTGITQGLLRRFKGKPFSTYDKDNTGRNDTNCALVRQAGWWFKKSDPCMIGHLNGKHSNLNGPTPGWMWTKPPMEEETGVYWQNTHGKYFLVKSSKMMIRRRSITRITASADGSYASIGGYQRNRNI